MHCIDMIFCCCCLILYINWQHTACPLQLCQLGCVEWTFLTWLEWPKCLPVWLYQFTPLKFPLPILDNSWYRQTFFIIANPIPMTWCHIVLIKFPWLLGRLWAHLMSIGDWASCFICTGPYCFLLLQWNGKRVKIYSVYHLLSIVCADNSLRLKLASRLNFIIWKVYILMSFAVLILCFLYGWSFILSTVSLPRSQIGSFSYIFLNVFMFSHFSLNLLWSYFYE